MVDPITVKSYGNLRLFTVRQASVRLKIKSETVEQLVRSGRLRSRLDGDKVYIIASSLEALERKMAK